MARPADIRGSVNYIELPIIFDLFEFYVVGVSRRNMVCNPVYTGRIAAMYFSSIRTADIKVLFKNMSIM